MNEPQHSAFLPRNIISFQSVYLSHGVYGLKPTAFIFLSSSALSSVAIGAAGTYFAEKYTDERRKKEQKNEDLKTFTFLATRMTDLLSEMKSDLAGQGHAEWREFYVIPKGTIINTRRNSFFYEDDKMNGFLSKVRTLEEYGLVYDITPGNSPMFRMSDQLVMRLNEWKPNA